MQRAYLDWNATAPLRQQARAAVLAALEQVGNPSSVHGEGRAARRTVEEARERVAELVGADPRNVVFTSGGSEANTQALTPGLADCLLVSAVEHPSVLAGGRFTPEAVERMPVDRNGVIDLTALEARLTALARAGKRPMLSLMAANNETGVIEPTAAAAAIVHAAGGVLHVDAVQAVRLGVDIRALGADLVSLSAHKLGGPKGVGALVKADEAIRPSPLISGGGQERGERAGTENVAGIAGFGAAAAALRQSLGAERDHVHKLRDRLEAGIRALTPEAVILGETVERLPNTTLVAMPGAKAETLIIAMDLDGVAVSAGSACSSGKVAASHVLAAMGVDGALARSAIRVSTGPTTTEQEIDRFLEVWSKLTQSLSKGRSSRNRGLAA